MNTVQKHRGLNLIFHRSGPVTVRDMVWQLRRHLHIYECNLYGHVSSEDELVLNIIFVPALRKPTLTQVSINVRQKFQKD